MEIKASDLKRGVEVDSGKYTLLWNKKTNEYNICEYAKPKEIYYRYPRLHDAVRNLNSLTGFNDIAVDDEGDLPNYWRS